MISQILVASSAGIILMLGFVHLILTFRSDALSPKDQKLHLKMKEEELVLTPETTIWKAWIGFNASHSLGAILFGIVLGYLVIFYPSFLFGSWLLQIVGLLYLGAFLGLAKAYWFSSPFRGILVSLLLYLAGLFVSSVTSVWN